MECFVLSAIKCRLSQNAPFPAVCHFAHQDSVACAVRIQDAEDTIHPATMDMAMAVEMGFPGIPRGLEAEAAAVIALMSTTSANASPYSKTFMGTLTDRILCAERRMPLIPGSDAMPEQAAGVRPAPHTAPAASTNLREPLKPRPLGLLAGDRMDKQLFDDKMTSQSEMRWDGGKNGPAWKSKVQSYMWSKVPALLEILKWAEKHDKAEVTEEALDGVVGHFLERPKQEVLNAAIWGFLSSCLSGSAETIFKSAEDLNGLDAWRRVVRIIDSGLLLRLEELRGEVRMLHTRPMKDLDQVNAGIAEFEAKLKEYKDAGGTGFDGDHEKKSDLLAILLAKLREDHLLTAAGKESYIEFRDLVLMQTSRILFNRRRGGGGAVHGLEFEPAAAATAETDGADEGVFDELFLLAQNGSRNELIAAMQKFQRRTGGSGQRQPQRA